MNIGNFFKLVLTFVTTYLGYFLGGFDAILGTLIIFIVIDYFTGVVGAIYNKKLSSSVGFKGIYKKVIVLLMVAIATRLEIVLGIKEIRYVVISFYLANEGVSIIENAALIGVNVPKKIVEIDNQFKVNISDLRVRNNTSTESDETIIGLASYNGIYNCYKIKNENGYNWYNIDENQWIAEVEKSLTYIQKEQKNL